MNDSEGVNKKMRAALNVPALHAIAAAQAVNANPQQIDAGRLDKVLAAIEARVHEAQEEMGL